MGVNFKDIISFEEIKFGELEGKIVAVDAANTIYQFLSSIRQRDGTPLMDHKGMVTSHLSGILYRTSSLIDKGIKPIYIFDGQSHVLKENTRIKRSEIRIESEKKWKKALEKGKIQEAKKYAIRSSRMSADVIESSKVLLDLMGLPYIQAKSEGEAQAAYMVEKGDAWCVASQDYDCILFGASRMVRNLAVAGTKTKLEFIELKEVLGKLNLSRKQLVDVAILVGTDFNNGIKGIGAKTGLKLIKEHGNILEVLEHLKIKMEVDPELVREIFLNPEIISNYKLKWKKPDKNKIIDFLCLEHDFSEDRVIGAIEKLNKLSSTQKSLEDWF